MRRIFLALIGLAIAAGYTWLLSVVTGGLGAATIRRGVILAAAGGAYGWCFGRERWIPTTRLVADQMLMPLALLGAAVAGAVVLLGFAVTWTTSALLRK